ncbi:hypothetical protein [Sphingomonas sp. BK235]|uniref:hypothetical protein n=1 Tax=Sphingomonas sp. BK235 TaxID=2512131 RepID=UPI001045BADC|nr:hypothetical protein [Sphingomonas sp. BK235]TCP30381.1 hypothetical protein EV292_11354 [Sphingomonas sp. BK235]
MENAPFSPLRWRLCSALHARRVAQRMQAEGLDVVLLLTGDRMQPWRVIERAHAPIDEVSACA